MDFWRFWAVRHNLGANCAVITTDRPEQSAYKIFSIKRRFQWFNFHIQVSTPKVKGGQRTIVSNRGTPLKVVILPLLAHLA